MTLRGGRSASAMSCWRVGGTGDKWLAEDPCRFFILNTLFWKYVIMYTSSLQTKSLVRKIALRLSPFYLMNTRDRCEMMATRERWIKCTEDWVTLPEVPSDPYSVPTLRSGRKMRRRRRRRLDRRCRYSCPSSSSALWRSRRALGDSGDDGAVSIVRALSWLIRFIKVRFLQ